MFSNLFSICFKVYYLIKSVFPFRFVSLSIHKGAISWHKYISLFNSISLSRCIWWTFYRFGHIEISNKLKIKKINKYGSVPREALCFNFHHWKVFLFGLIWKYKKKGNQKLKRERNGRGRRKVVKNLLRNENRKWLLHGIISISIYMCVFVCAYGRQMPNNELSVQSGKLVLTIKLLKFDAKITLFIFLLFSFSFFCIGIVDFIVVMPDTYTYTHACICHITL